MNLSEAVQSEVEGKMGGVLDRATYTEAEAYSDLESGWWETGPASTLTVYKVF